MPTLSVVRALSVCFALSSFGALATPIAGETSRDILVDVRFGPYRPLIGSEYARSFANRFMILGEVSVAWEFFQKFGSLSVGGSVGYSEIFDTELKFGVKTGLTMVPMKLFAQYRFDWFFANFDVPLIPYVQGGLALVHWNVVNPTVDTLGAGRDLSLGGFVTGGLAIPLDFLDPRVARDFDNSVGINHVYLFAEFCFQQVQPLNVLTLEAASLPLNSERRTYDVSSRHWMFGLGFEL
jgi:hypothetical protein